MSTDGRGSRRNADLQTPEAWTSVDQTIQKWIGRPPIEGIADAITSEAPSRSLPWRRERRRCAPMGRWRRQFGSSFRNEWVQVCPRGPAWASAAAGWPHWPRRRWPARCAVGLTGSAAGRRLLPPGLYRGGGSRSRSVGRPGTGVVAVLLHSHVDEHPLTRDEVVRIPRSLDMVVVEAHEIARPPPGPSPCASVPETLSGPCRSGSSPRWRSGWSDRGHL